MISFRRRVAYMHQKYSDKCFDARFLFYGCPDTLQDHRLFVSSLFNACNTPRPTFIRVNAVLTPLDVLGHTGRGRRKSGKKGEIVPGGRCVPSSYFSLRRKFLDGERFLFLYGSRLNTCVCCCVVVCLFPVTNVWNCPSEKSIIVDRKCGHFLSGLSYNPVELCISYFPPSKKWQYFCP